MEQNMSKETEQKIMQLQLLEQSLQNFLSQKQQFQAQLLEVHSALKELDVSKNAFKIVGNIMVSSNKEDLKKSLKEKEEVLELRIKTLEKQEKKMKEKAKEMQSDVMKELKPKE